MRRTLLLTVTALLASAPALRAGAVGDWSLNAQRTIVDVGKKFPGEAAVYMGVVHAAIYDAAAAVSTARRPPASLDASVATAAHRVLVGLFPAQQADLDAAYAASLSVIPDGQQKTQGIAAGDEVGGRILELPTVEGLGATVGYVQPPPGPGVYEPTANATPLGTKLPQVTPLVLNSADQFRPDGPSPLTSEEYAADLQQVKALGRSDSTVRTEEQTRIALFWTDHDIPQWNRNLVRLASERGLGELQSARMLAMAHVAGADAMIACFDAKYHYLSWRPLHAIARADSDGNPLTEPDPTWQPLRPTPNHPEYPSAHACHSTAVAVALQEFFGTNKVPLSLDSLVTGERRYYARLTDVVREVNLARVWAGFHFWSSDREGSILGRMVGRYVVRHFPVRCQRR